jgi:CRISPR-associated protein Csx14
MSYPESNITINLDVTNPGQFFACCGLLELADRLWPGAEGWFGDCDRTFCISSTGGTLGELVKSIATAELIHVRPDDPYSSPVVISTPFRSLSIDWWETDLTGARDLKVWAGTMESFGIAQAMQHAMREQRFCDAGFLDIGMVVTTPQDGGKKKEPYYFDARRTPNAHSRDVGFAANDLGMTSIAHPALLSNLLLAASTGSLHWSDLHSYRFENWFRTGQKKHKAFRSAIPRS